MAKTRDRPRISVVVPTHQRRDLVTRNVRALDAQRGAPTYEVIVVVDGSTDGTAQALRALSTRCPLTVLEQPNRGAAAARNAGAARALGDVILFLDDDMEAAPDLLAVHDRAHLEGARACIGLMPLHPDSSATLLARGAGSWASDMAARLGAGRGPLAVDDIVTGQLSVDAALLRDIGVFDADFTSGGTYGGEDLELGQRLLAAGEAVEFLPDAISHQHYVVTAAQHLRQYRQAGASDVALARKHPGTATTLHERRRTATTSDRIASRLVTASPRMAAAVSAALRPVAVALVDRGQQGPAVTRLFYAVRAVEYWRGVADAGGFPAGGP